MRLFNQPKRLSLMCVCTAKIENKPIKWPKNRKQQIQPKPWYNTYFALVTWSITPPLLHVCPSEEIVYYVSLIKRIFSQLQTKITTAVQWKYLVTSQEITISIHADSRLHALILSPFNIQCTSTGTNIFLKNLKIR